MHVRVATCLTENGYFRTIMSAKGLFADTLSGVGPDPNAPADHVAITPPGTAPKHCAEPISSMVSTWRGSGEHVVIHVEQPQLSSLVSTQRGSGAYAALAALDYHSVVTAGQTLPLGTRVDPSLALEQKARDSLPPTTPRLSTLPANALPPGAQTLTTPMPAFESFLPNTVSLVANPARRRGYKLASLTLAAAVVCIGALLIPVQPTLDVTLVPALSHPAQSAHALHAGIVGKVHVEVGDIVTPGQVLVSLDENERSHHAEGVRLRINRLNNELEQLVSTDQRLHNAALGALNKKRALLLDRLAQRADSSNGELTNASSANASDTVLHLRQQLADVDFLRNDRKRSFEQRRRTAEAALSEAHAELLQSNSIELTTRAKTRARVRRVLVEPGNPVILGAPLLELVPLGAPVKLVGYIPYEMASRVNSLTPIVVNLGPLMPVGASADQVLYDTRPTFVADVPASSEELQAVLGFVPDKVMRRIELPWPQEALSQAASTAAATEAVVHLDATLTPAREMLGVHWLRSAKWELHSTL